MWRPPIARSHVSNPILAALRWLGRRGTRALAVLVTIGVAVPPLGHLLRPYLPEAVFLLLTLSFLRVDVVALRQHLRNPALILGATLWTAIGVPLLFYTIARLTGVQKADPGVFAGLMLQGLASPMMAAPALAALMGLDATLVLVTLVTGTILVPFVVPALAPLALGRTLLISPVSLGSRLGLTLAGSFLVAGIFRRFVGVAAIERHRDAVNGVNIIVLMVFASAVMGDVASMAVTDPGAFISLTALAFLVFGLLLLATALLFHRAGRIEALSLGIMASQRNMGLMFAAIDSALPKSTWLYFALCQFPIYLSPLLLPPLFKTLGRRAAA